VQTREFWVIFLCRMPKNRQPELPDDTGNLVDDLERLARVLRPRGNNPVAFSQHFQFIMESGIKGIKPDSIRSALLQRHGEDPDVPSADYIAAYFAENLPPDLRLPFFQLERFQDPRRRVNPFTTLIELVALQRYRVGEAVTRDQGGESSQGARREIDLCRKICCDVINVAQSLGQIPWVVPTPQVVAPAPQQPRLINRTITTESKPNGTVVREDSATVLAGITPDEAARILDLIGDVDGPDAQDDQGDIHDA
jgi:hypothetical protein